MINIDNQFNLNRILLLASGLWPHKKSKLAQLYSLSCFTILTTLIIFQFTTFVTSKCTLDLVFQVASPTSAFSIIVITYYSFYNNNKIVTYFIEQLKHVCNEVKDKNEIIIIEQYSNYGKRFAIICTTLAACGFLFVLGIQLWPTLRDIILFAKVSRPQRWQLKMEYFIDEEKYFYLPLLHINIAFNISNLVALGVPLFLFMYLQYVCAMFQIASYRIEHVMEINTVQDVILLNEKMIYKKIVYAIDIHRKAMMFADKLMSTFQIDFFIILTFITIDAIINFYYILRIVSLGYAEELRYAFLMSCILGFVALLIIFYLNLLAQQIIDENEHIFVTAYKIRWYLAPVCIQKLILFLLQRGTKPFNLRIGKLFIGSLQNFFMMSNTIASYCTVMYSVGL